MAVLVIQEGNLPSRRFEVTKPKTLIGRRTECDLVLDFNVVSREHASIEREGRRFVLVDLKSRSRTKLNGEFIKALEPVPLKSGDRISICDVEIDFYEGEPPKPPDWLDYPVEDGGSTIQLLDASRSDVLASILKPEVKLKAILEISRKLANNFDLPGIAAGILESLMDLYPHSERAFLVLLRHDGPQSWAFERDLYFHKVRARKSGSRSSNAAADSTDEPSIRLSRSLINEVVEGKQSVRRQYPGDGQQSFSASESIADLRIRSVMCVPLLAVDGPGISGGKVIGILQLDTSDAEQFESDDLDVLDAVARQVAMAIQNASLHKAILRDAAMNRDLELAEDIQRQFLPSTVPQVPGFEFFARYQPARRVGGDYYDFVPLGTDRLAVVLGDVSGKGIPAALLMAKFSGETRASILIERDPAPALSLTNALMCEVEFEDKFITLAVCVLDIGTGRLTYASAGHEPILVRRANGQCEELGESLSKCFPLGIDAQADYVQGETILAPGDVLIIYSDGVTDAVNPAGDKYDRITNRRLRARLASLPGSPVSVGEGILQEIREFCRDQAQADDITLVCFGPTRP